MRLDILNRGYNPGTRLLFALIQLFSRQPVPDAAKLVFYRPGFYGTRAKKFTHEAMRGPSAWSVGDRELMAAHVSTATACSARAWSSSTRNAAISWPARPDRRRPACSSLWTGETSPSRCPISASTAGWTCTSPGAGRRIELLHFGTLAHTTNDIVVWLPQERILFAGDLAFNGGTPFALSGSVTRWLDVLAALGELDPAIVIPGHGPPGGPEVLAETAGYLKFVLHAATDAHAVWIPSLRAAAELSLGRFAGLTDSERIAGNLHQAYAELNGHERGSPIDDAQCFADMLVFNGGAPLRCLA